MASGILVATRKGLFRFARQGNAWSIERTAFLGDNVTYAVDDPRSGIIHASLNHGHFGVKLHRSTDGGKTFAESTPPTYPPQPAAPPPKEGEKSDVTWALQLLWTIVPGGSDEPGVLWAGTIPGGLFRSRDDGKTWSLCEALWNQPLRRDWGGGGYDSPGIHSICVDPRDSKHVLVGISTGGVWETTDGGATFTLRGDGMRAEYMPPNLAHDPVRQDVHCMVQCRADPRWVWVQHHNGMFVSEDGAHHFRELTDVKPSAFGFPVVVHPADPRTAWFVPAIKDEKRIPVNGKLVVNRTRDGGNTFTPLTAGLPQQHCYDLIYRHGMDIDDVGNTLCIGSTTGSLWLSDNGGDSWQTLSTHLPPIYSVRFC